MTITRTDIANVCHEANRVAQRIFGDPAVPVSAHWFDLDDETQRSVLDGVDGILAGNTAEESHANWCRFKVAHGWRWGPVKSELDKTHPALIRYGLLSPEVQAKDHLFRGIVLALTPLLGDTDAAATEFGDSERDCAG
ncbi:RyR domain-containing protein [Rhodococcus sp. NPDC003994]